MSFVTTSFFFFAASVALLYFALPGKTKWILLLVASYVFYWLSSEWLIFFMICATLCTFAAGQILAKMQKRFEQEKTEMSREEAKAAKLNLKRKKRLVLSIALAIVLGFLIFFKYGFFIGENANVILMQFGLGALPIESIVMPIGISFYTFQSLGYLIDVYRGACEADRNVARFALFVSFFPQIVQGPIGRYGSLAQQLYEPHRFDYKRAKQGLLLIAYGLFKKLVIADRIGIFVVDVIDTSPQMTDGSLVLITILFYGLQLYCDFSGGIDIARGFSRVLGIELAENFRRPYYAVSMEDFWRRWHITLGSWMRDYVFYPLMLSKAAQKLSRSLRKKSHSATVRAIPVALATFVTFMCVGIWHGADWKWVVFALINAGVIAASTMLEPLYCKFHEKSKIRDDSPLYLFFMRLRTLLIVSLSRVFARALTFSQAVTMLSLSITSFSFAALAQGLFEHGLHVSDYAILCVGVLVLFVVGHLQEQGKSIHALFSRLALPVRWLVYVGIVLVLALFSVVAQTEGVVFIYGRF